MSAVRGGTAGAWSRVAVGLQATNGMPRPRKRPGAVKYRQLDLKPLGHQRAREEIDGPVVDPDCLPGPVGSRCTRKALPGISRECNPPILARGEQPCLGGTGAPLRPRGVSLALHWHKLLPARHRVPQAVATREMSWWGSVLQASVGSTACAERRNVLACGALLNGVCSRRTRDWSVLLFRRQASQTLDCRSAAAYLPVS